MTMSLTCKNCNEVMTADDEDVLVATVQAHVSEHARQHGRDHVVSREQILARLHREVPKDG